MQCYSCLQQYHLNHVTIFGNKCLLCLGKDDNSSISEESIDNLFPVTIFEDSSSSIEPKEESCEENVIFNETKHLNLGVYHKGYEYILKRRNKENKI